MYRGCDLLRSQVWCRALAIAHGFADLHVFVCASLLLMWRGNILALTEFDTLLKFLQASPKMTEKKKEKQKPLLETVA